MLRFAGWYACDVLYCFAIHRCNVGLGKVNVGILVYKAC